LVEEYDYRLKLLLIYTGEPHRARSMEGRCWSLELSGCCGVFRGLCFNRWVASIWVCISDHNSILC